MLHDACLLYASLDDIPQETANLLIEMLVRRNHLPTGYNNLLYKYISAHTRDECRWLNNRQKINNFYATESLMQFLNDYFKQYAHTKSSKFGIDDKFSHDEDIYIRMQAEDDLLIHQVEKYLELIKESELKDYQHVIDNYLHKVKDELTYIMYKLNELTHTSNEFYKAIARKAELFIELALHYYRFDKIDEFIKRAKLSISPLVNENVKLYSSYALFNNKCSPLRVLEKPEESKPKPLNSPSF